MRSRRRKRRRRRKTEIPGEEEAAAVRRGKRRNDKSLPPFADGEEVNRRAPRIRQNSRWGERETAFRARVRAGVVGRGVGLRFETIWFNRALGRVDRFYRVDSRVNPSPRGYPFDRGRMIERSYGLHRELDDVAFQPP